MSVRMRHTSSHTKNRRSHHALKNRVIVKDKESGALRLPHRLDESNGTYRGKQIVAKREVKAKRADHEKRLAAHKHEHPEGERQPVHAEAAEAPKKEGLIGRMTKGRARARSGMGGGA
ncbi:MAG TPA: 50S ribosomal protein L32 [Candidatus Paceibacterota bacterium]|nr:50S ribosomal protein L32 [Candidatus Paceibacterota bacterium]